MVEAEPSSRETALSERRLVLTVDADGVVTEVDDGPSWLFGFAPQQLLGRSLADVVTTLRPPARIKRSSGGAPKPPAPPAAAQDPASAAAADAGGPVKGEDEVEEVPVTELLSMLITK